MKRILGKTLTGTDGMEKDSDMIVFHFSDGTNYQMSHDQDCCETVTVDDVVGDPDDLIGEPILLSEETTFDPGFTPKAVAEKENSESFTWTFYRIGTIKGEVTIRWYGESNGYYSEEVSFGEIKN